MCGIAGIFKINDSRNEAAVEFVDKLVASQTYRGPDDQKIESLIENNTQIIMGHNRLAIVDLSKHANQPMWDNENRYGIIFNGMIYNFHDLREELKLQQYSFKTNSDTEVLLNAFSYWGVDCFERLNGMFAFAIYDKLEKSLYLVRDRFGVKPLYYIIKNNVLYFASTSHELAKQLQLDWNDKYLYHGLHTWCYDNNSHETAYKGLKLLPPSSVMKIHFDENALIKTQFFYYYNLEKKVLELRENIFNKTYGELISLTEHEIKKAISCRLIADVPLGISLSGGVDSATIAAFVAEMKNDIRAFSFGHPSDKFSEGKRVEQLANYLRVNVEYVKPDNEEMVNAFWQSLFFQDAPFPNFSIPAQYLVYNKAKQSNVKVLLGGQGGDEIFMGYRKFLLFHFQDLVKEKKPIHILFFLITMMQNLTAELSQLPRYFDALRRYSTKRTLQSNLQILQVRPESLSLSHEKTLLHRQITDVLHTSLPTLLRYEDRNSMANSIESRLPFLDYNLVELGIALPTALKLKNGYGKWILRQISHNLLPKKYMFSRAKRGFDTQTMLWIKAGVGQSIRNFLKDNSSVMSHFSDSKIIIDKLYSDNNLIRNSFLLHEAIILSWLVGKSQKC